MSQQGVRVEGKRSRRKLGSPSLGALGASYLLNTFDVMMRTC